MFTVLTFTPFQGLRVNLKSRKDVKVRALKKNYLLILFLLFMTSAPREFQDYQFFCIKRCCVHRFPTLDKGLAKI